VKYRIMGAVDAVLSTAPPPPSKMAARLNRMHMEGTRIRVAEVTVEVGKERPWTDRWWKKVMKLDRANSELLFMEARHGA
jgi:hypothetical protein